MTPTRVEIGRLVVRGGGLSHVEGAALSRLVSANLKQLLSQSEAPAKSRVTHAVEFRGGPHHPGSHVAGTVAQAVYRSIRGRI
jgi:hypothetical protein